jgi:hypothetical protein
MSRELLVPVHGHPLAVPAHFAVCSGRDGARAVATTDCGALLEREQLLGTERLVVDLRRRLDQVLQMGAGKEVAKVYEFAVVLVLDWMLLVGAETVGVGGHTIDEAPTILATSNLLAVHNDVLLGANNSEGDNALHTINIYANYNGGGACLDGGVEGNFLVVVLLVVVRVHAQVVECELLLYPLLELGALLERQAVALGNDGNNVDELTQLLEHDDVDGLEAVARGVDEEQAAVDARVLEVALTLGGKLLAQVSTVLVLDVLDDGVPAALVVDQVTVAGGVNDVEAKTDAILFDCVGDGLDLGGLADGLVGLHTTLAIYEVRGEDGVDEGRLAEASLSCAAVSPTILRKPCCLLLLLLLRRAREAYRRR